MNDIRVLFGKPSSEIKELFESIGISMVLSYMKKEPLIIPYVGEVHIKYEGDETTSKGRKAMVSSEFVPSEFLIRNIGQVEDETKTDAENILLQRLKLIFRQKLK
ncbi:MAG: hypothetical protein ACRCZB_05280 [Bacteroidales bacterium]